MFRLMHSWRLVCRALLISLLTISPINAVIANAAPHLVIGEVAWSGSSAGTSDEWLELWNLDDADLSISGFALIGASGQPLIFPADTIVQSRGSFLVSNYSDTDPKSALNAVPQLLTTAVSLSNSSLCIVLNDASVNELDRVGIRRGLTRDLVIHVDSSIKFLTAIFPTICRCDNHPFGNPHPNLTSVRK